MKKHPLFLVSFIASVGCSAAGTVTFAPGKIANETISVQYDAAAHTFTLTDKGAAEAFVKNGRLDNAGAIQVPGVSIGGNAGELTLGVRPEHITVGRSDEGLAARVDLIEHLGDGMILYARLHGSNQPVTVRLSGERTGIAPGHDVGIIPKADRTLLFDASGHALSAALPH